VWRDGLVVSRDVLQRWTVDHPWNPVPSNPSPDYDVAEFVAEKIGAKIINYDQPQYVDGRDY
jgi:hypothetical protein